MPERVFAICQEIITPYHTVIPRLLNRTSDSRSRTSSVRRPWIRDPVSPSLSWSTRPSTHYPHSWNVVSLSRRQEAFLSSDRRNCIHMSYTVIHRILMYVRVIHLMPIPVSAHSASFSLRGFCAQECRVRPGLLLRKG